MVDITVEGHANKLFKCPVGWTMKEAKDEIRERYGLMNRGIERNGEAAKSKDVIEEGEGIAYVFVDGEKIETECTQTSSK